MIICAVLAALAPLSTPDTLRKVGRFAAGAQIITGGADRMVRWIAMRKKALAIRSNETGFFHAL